MERGRTTAKPVETMVFGGEFRIAAIARRYVRTVDTIVSPSRTIRRALLGASSNDIFVIDRQEIRIFRWPTLPNLDAFQKTAVKPLITLCHT